MTAVPHQFKDLMRDYRDSWSSRTGGDGKRDRRRAAWYFYGIPLILASVFAFVRIEIAAVAPFLTAMSVFTALLFGLLFLVFNLAVSIRKDGNVIANAHGLGDVVTDLRSTIMYTILIAVLLVAVLAVAAASMVPSNPCDPTSALVLPWAWTPFLIGLGAHLVLNVLKILERFRTAFNYVLR